MITTVHQLFFENNKVFKLHFFFIFAA